MNLKLNKTKYSKRNPVMSIAYEIVKNLFTIERESFFIKKMDNESNGHIVKKQLRCTISSCFDMHNICCKVCDIKKCRYKCNFIDKEECEHQKLD
ncbi:MAG: hypothetical protein ACYCYE_17110 [Clostridia bacterium]